MTLETGLQLFAAFCSVGGMLFFAGRVTQMVKSMGEIMVQHDKRISKLENRMSAAHAVHNTIHPTKPMPPVE